MTPFATPIPRNPPRGEAPRNLHARRATFGPFRLALLGFAAVLALAPAPARGAPPPDQPPAAAPASWTFGAALRRAWTRSAAYPALPVLAALGREVSARAWQAWLRSARYPALIATWRRGEPPPGPALAAPPPVPPAEDIPTLLPDLGAPLS
jgi:hypothetical protein